ncbi:MerR family transcriptional regulator [Mycolicibacterium goodii]|uniref:MerR family transcriptional regulator n=1 Tax=Mycolicibacterium goodii TaxID=134601 RepID=UPI001BDCA98A|nr:helix-turn-helix domain-containing protein [Mycolicibacterium goodii]MBU8833643.1 helix-turn-helix domain-containing protein [Mycolicibacterium goodii]
MSKHAATNAGSGEFLAPSEAAALIGISRDTIKRWEKSGRITAMRTPLGHRRYRRSDVEALLTSGSDTAEASA